MDGELSRAWRKIRKRRGHDDPSGAVTDLRGIMSSLVPGPPAMGDEIAEFFLGDQADDESVYKADEVLDLLAGIALPDESLLDMSDWEFIRDTVNGWAEELDMRIVTDVMRRVVERGGFSRTS